ncbi:SPASM domain-containing protein [Spirosoma sp. RP8]|uniref:SPASM domain-containing protein n=1 Tax=Spirosoma liriopis TaxID=2937440 RepID=A0ABT0HSZ0_9BACT|nr:radical SAM protein [Spirosoma liriopis]MCK8495286.1 SPASM domain-containing protein [Spirosoma liriopis]
MNFKRSHYIVVTDTIAGLIPKRVLLATRTARVLVVSESLHQKLEREAWDEMHDNDFDKLRQIEAIVPVSEDELSLIINRNKAAVADSQTLYHVIQPTAMCQLGCGYCGQQHTKDYISGNAAERILERIKSKFDRKRYNHVEIAWFGGEPLMAYAQIRALTPKIQEMARLHNCTYSAKLVTNGLSLKEPVFLELVRKHDINTIEVTLDGTAEYHDARRHTKEGLSTFNLIFQNLIKIYNRPDFKELGCSISIRCNVDERNKESVLPLIQLLAEYNLQDKIAYFYVAAIHSWGNDAHKLSLEKQTFADEEIDWIMEQYKYGFSPGLVPKLNPVVCLSVTPDAEVFDAFGNVFDCTEVPYVETYENSKYKVGNVNDGLDSLSSHRELLSFHDEILAGKYSCTSCPMLPVCGGGCPKSWRENMAACPTNKFNIKDKLLMHYAMRKNGKEEFVALLTNS